MTQVLLSLLVHTSIKKQIPFDLEQTKKKELHEKILEEFVMKSKHLEFRF